jgi:hypothetical protein
MEEININQEPVSQTLNLDPDGIGHLKETRAWTNFLSIVGFVFLGIMLLFGIAGGSAISRMNPMASEMPTFGSGFLLFVVIIMILIYFFPIYFLYNFSRYSKLAITHNDPVAFSESMRYLKLHYRYMGIIAIIILSIYILAFIIMLMAGSLASMF